MQFSTQPLATSSTGEYCQVKSSRYIPRATSLHQNISRERPHFPSTARHVDTRDRLYGRLGGHKRSHVDVSPRASSTLAFYLECDRTTAMSGRILSHRLAPLVRNGLARHIHNAGSRTGGLLRADGAALRGRAWPVGANAIHNNVPAVRAFSFGRMLPKLALKLVRVPAMFGGATIAGFAYIQYQTTRM